jgi:hypothetical protein
MIRHPIAKYRLDLLLDLIPYLLMSLPHLCLDSAGFDVMHLTLDIVFLPLLPHNGLQSGSILDPLYHASGSSKRYYGIRAEPQVPLAALRVILEHLIAEDSEINEALLLPQVSVLVALKEEVVHLLIGADYTDLLGFLFGDHNGGFVEETCNQDWLGLKGWELLKRARITVIAIFAFLVSFIRGLLHLARGR